MPRLAVLGSPIEHSLSPVLQNTAFRLLGVPFEYGRVEVRAGGLPDFLRSLGDDWVGLSLTMPLKREVIPLLDEASPLVTSLGVANTVVIAGATGPASPRHLTGFNTDVDGITRAVLARSDVRHREATIVGGGATAVSALAAARELGVEHVTVHLRDPSKAGSLAALAERLGVVLATAPLSDLGGSGPVGFVLSTLPGGAEVPAVHPAGPDSVLLDVAYDPWPSPLARAWEERGGIAVSGLDMLVEQAIGQVRLFTGRAQDAPLPDEDPLRVALREAVGLPGRV
ncbi:Shikimate dehydrogenase (NADP(+)) [Frondihabitans sp. 762G35]|uniref:shikimate dehydrogenase family protein n=1 Tax=Frondihabitans sp. 762G35 TaxID=1446794 RepID=UPI000D215DE5|nr:shikimate dehydrogenase [Frondihabitans sp. 762G35]ARC57778.1 Shikimate dehydrogenase (NADP(+)) [Frondihabitans sp. 762G35]